MEVSNSIVGWGSSPPIIHGLDGGDEPHPTELLKDKFINGFPSSAILFGRRTRGRSVDGRSLESFIEWLGPIWKLLPEQETRILSLNGQLLELSRRDFRSYLVSEATGETLDDILADIESYLNAKAIPFFDGADNLQSIARLWLQGSHPFVRQVGHEDLVVMAALALGEPELAQQWADRLVARLADEVRMAKRPADVRARTEELSRARAIQTHLLARVNEHGKADRTR